MIRVQHSFRHCDSGPKQRTLVAADRKATDRTFRNEASGQALANRAAASRSQTRRPRKVCLDRSPGSNLDLDVVGPYGYPHLVVARSQSDSVVVMLLISSHSDRLNQDSRLSYLDDTPRPDVGSRADAGRERAEQRSQRLAGCSRAGRVRGRHCAHRALLRRVCAARDQQHGYAPSGGPHVHKTQPVPARFLAEQALTAERRNKMHLGT